MLIFRIVMWVLIFIAIFGFLTQVFIPILRGRPTFPLFNRRISTLEARLAQVKQDSDAATLERVVREEEAKVGQIIKGTDSNPGA